MKEGKKENYDKELKEIINKKHWDTEGQVERKKK